MELKAGLAIFAIFLGQSTAYAIMPVPDESFLCATTHVVMGVVKKAVRIPWSEEREKFCRDKRWNCKGAGSCQDWDHQIELTIKITEIWGTPSADQIKTWAPPSPYTGFELKPVAAGQTIHIITSLWNNVCSPAASDAQGALTANPPNKGDTVLQSVSPKLLQRIYVGKTFVFGLSAVRLIGEDPNASPPYDADGPIRAMIFRSSRKAWVRDTLLKKDGVSCPKPIQAHHV